jgi:hypothetical protein
VELTRPISADTFGTETIFSAWPLSVESRQKLDFRARRPAHSGSFAVAAYLLRRGPETLPRHGVQL